jgi:antitoxin MazE
MPVKIQKWGNSLGVRIPKTVINKTNLGQNSVVAIESKNGTILIFPVKKKYSLDTLLKQITKSKSHSKQEFISEGNEVW